MGKRANHRAGRGHVSFGFITFSLQRWKLSPEKGTAPRLQRSPELLSPPPLHPVLVFLKYFLFFLFTILKCMKDSPHEAEPYSRKCTIFKWERQLLLSTYRQPLMPEHLRCGPPTRQVLASSYFHHGGGQSFLRSQVTILL